MNFKGIILYLFLFLFPLEGSSQSEPQKSFTEADTIQINNLLKESKDNLNDDPAKSITFAIQAKELAEKINFLKGKANAIKNIGLGYYYQGKYLETLENWNESLKIFEQLKDEVGVANILNNIAAIYGDQGDDAKALEYSLRSLTISEKPATSSGSFLRLIPLGIYITTKKLLKTKH